MASISGVFLVHSFQPRIFWEDIKDRLLGDGRAVLDNIKREAVLMLKTT